MKRIIGKLVVILPLLYILFSNAKAQGISAEPLFSLPEVIRETSGLVLLNDKLITINDSGNDARLFEIDPETGTLERDLLVENVTNGDWEDLAADQQFIYIADIGNNRGDRLDLKIYRIPLTDYTQSTDGTLTADSISFKYSDQTSFESTPLTNFDAEALIAYKDSLYIFTKNWADLHTNIYSIPKVPGEYEAEKVGRINAQGLVAGAAYNQAADEILLIGYDLDNTFLVRLYDFEPYKFDQGKISRIELGLQGSQQAEAIEAANDTEYFITVEGNDQGDAQLILLSTDFVVGLEDDPGSHLAVYPNPATETVTISSEGKQPLESVSVYNMMGAHIYTQSVTSDFQHYHLRLDLGSLPVGFYQLSIISGDHEVIRKLVISR